MKQTVFLLLLLCLAIPLPLYAQQDEINSQASAAPAAIDLAKVAQTDGQVRVIVELAAAFQPEGHFRSKAAVQRQRANIARSQAQVLGQLDSRHAQLVAAWETIPFMALVVDAQGLRALQQSPTVVGIQEDRLDFPLLGDSTVHIGAPKAWEAGYDGSGQMVVVIDSGIDRSHPFFGNRVVEEACFSGNYVLYPGGSPPSEDGIFSLCPNGQTMDTGEGAADALTSECQIGVNNVNYCWHGTAVAGVSSGANPGDLDFDGVAKGSDIGAIQVFTHFTTPEVCGSRSDCISSYTSDQISALEYVLTDLHPTRSIAAVNMSLGGTHYDDQAECDAAESSRKAIIDQLRSVGIPTIIAAGNSSTVNAIASPACISSAVAVSASTNPADLFWPRTSVHAMVELMAPGELVTAPRPTNYFADYIDSSGTSFAAPHVAGAWAILKQAIQDVEAAPANVSVDRILTLLQETGVPIDDNRDNGVVTDMPRIDLCAALTELDVDSGIELEAKVLLQGAFRDVDAGTGFLAGSLMRDTLRSSEVADGFQGNFFPDSEPYSTQFGFGRGEAVADPATVLAVEGGNAIVDWIYLELRDADSPATVLSTRAALLQRDGNVVDVDGFSPVSFDCTLPGNYYVAVRHRNHLGTMTAAPVALAATGTMVDFTDPSTVLWYNDDVYDGHQQALLNGLAMLRAGDANQDGVVSYDGTSTDSEAVNTAVLNAVTNLFGSLGYRYAGYHPEDVELSGEVIADGAGNEHGLLFYNVHNHPANGSGVLDFVIEEQLAIPGP